MRLEISPATHTSANRPSRYSLTRDVASETLRASCGGLRWSFDVALLMGCIVYRFSLFLLFLQVVYAGF